MLRNFSHFRPTPRKARSFRKSVAAGALAGSLTFGGCANHTGYTVEMQGPVTAETSAAPAGPRPEPEPQLPVASDAQLTLFGETPDRARIPFQSRASAPMKQHTIGSEGADFDVEASRDGKWMVFASTRHSPQPDIYLKTIDGQAVTQLTSDPAADVEPSFSPDGKRIVFASNRAGNWDLWMLNLVSGQSSQVTLSPMQEVHPSFAPDGKRMVYCAFNERAAQWELWTLQLDQPGSRRMIGIGLYPQWSPKGDSVLYQRARQRGGRWFSIWRVDLENGEPSFPQELAASSDMALIQPTWSPDGEYVAYGTARLSMPAANPQAHDAANTNPNTNVNGGPHPSDTGQSPLGKGGGASDPALARGGSESTRGDIWIVRADGAEPMQLTDGSGVHFGPAWSADGRVYFSSRQNGSENIWSVKASASPAAPVAQQTVPEEKAALTAHPAGRGG